MQSAIFESTGGPPVLLDGAWGTELQRRGLPSGEGGDVWTITHPREVEDIARSYVDAGSRIILTNSFGANRYTLQSCALEDRVAEVNEKAALISKRAAGERALVFGSIGPSGKILMMGDVKPDDLRSAFAEQAGALAAAGADGLVLETFSALDEALLALEAALDTGLPVAACMAFGDDGHTMMGVTAEQAARELTAAGADAVGANCGVGVESFLPLCNAMSKATDRPLWMKANAGIPAIREGRTVWQATPASFAGHAVNLAAAGAAFIGGCCGTGPDFIRALAERI